MHRRRRRVFRRWRVGLIVAYCPISGPVIGYDALLVTANVHGTLFVTTAVFVTTVRGSGFVSGQVFLSGSVFVTAVADSPTFVDVPVCGPVVGRCRRLCTIRSFGHGAPLLLAVNPNRRSSAGRSESSQT